MIKIETNESARQTKIDKNFEYVVSECQRAAQAGRNNVYVTLDRDIQRDVRDALHQKTNIFVAINYGASPSRLCVEYFGDKVEIKFTWS
jgi:cell division protein FtsI/penicillin-binding protein 2